MSTRFKNVIRLVFSMALLVAADAKGSEPAGTIAFEDRTAQVGLQIPNGASCWADIDNDQWVDLCAAGAVWKNVGGKQFTKVADVGTSVAADFDNDGFVDFFCWSGLKLFRNVDGKQFAEFPLPELPACVSRGACWADLNGDGFVDLFVGGYEDWNRGITYPDMILINDGGKAFKLSWTETRYRARGVTACDFDEDGDPDIYVSNYRLQPNLLWLNEGTGKFREAAAEYNVVATSAGFGGGHAIGSAWGDFDNDGQIDLFAGNFAHRDSRGDQPKSRFLKNLGPDKSFHFEDLGICGVYYQESYASPSAGDYDNDGDLDLFFTTVYGTASFGKKNHPVLFRNDGEFKFVDATKSAQLANLPPTYQAAWADYNNDGQLDLVAGGKLFHNPGGPSRWLKVSLRGDGVAVNRSAVGAQVRIQLKDKVLTRQVESGTGEGNQNDLTLHFGLGRFEAPVSVKVLWPNGATQIVENVETNRLIVIDFKESR